MATTVDPRLIHPTSYRLIAEAIEEEGGEVPPHTHSIDQVEGLQTVLNAKQASGSYATSAQLDALIARVEGLEQAAQE